MSAIKLKGFNSISTLFSLILLVTITSCNKENQNSGEIGWFSLQEMFEAKKLGQIIINPDHRNGPNELSTSAFSNLPLTVWAPEGENGKLPVVIYSHGGGSRVNPGISGESWAKFLAQNGYAVIAMHHMARSEEDIKRNICFEIGVNSQNCDLRVYKPYHESIDRPQDAVAVLDSLEMIASEFGIELDESRIAILGFSGGTNTTHYLAGGERDASYGFSNEQNFYRLKDSRPKAFAAMSSGGGVQSGWTEESLSSIDVPFLCTTGLGDLSYEVRAGFHDDLTGSDQFRMFINGVHAEHVVFNHEFTGSTEGRTNQQLFHGWLESALLAFVEAYVNDNSEAESWLRSNEIERLMNGMLNKSDDYPSWDFR